MYIFHLLSSRLHMLYFLLFRIEQPDRQQYMSAARGDANQSRHREARWEGLTLFSKQKHIKGCTIVPPLLCMNQKYISDLKSERLPLCWCALVHDLSKSTN
jgi:hypothetical protein